MRMSYSWTEVEVVPPCWPQEYTAQFWCTGTVCTNTPFLGNTLYPCEGGVTISSISIVFKKKTNKQQWNNTPLVGRLLLPVLNSPRKREWRVMKGHHGWHFCHLLFLQQNSVFSCVLNASPGWTRQGQDLLSNSGVKSWPTKCYDEDCLCFYAFCLFKGFYSLDNEDRSFSGGICRSHKT